MKTTARHLSSSPRLVAVLATLVLSVIWYLYQQPINVDAVKYLAAAKLFLDGGFRVAAAEFSWPFYPICIGLLAKFSGLSLLNSAYVLNAFFYALISFSFVSILKRLDANLPVQWLGVFIIVFYPGLVHEHSMLVRDFGYYGFALLSLNFFILFLQTPHYRHAICWSACLVIAALFRSEAIAFLAAVPFFMLAAAGLNWIEKIKAFFKLYTINILVGVPAIFLLLFSHGHLSHQLLSAMMHGALSFGQMQEHHFHILDTYLFNEFGKSSIIPFMVAGILGILIAGILATLGIVYLILIVTGLVFRAASTFDFNSRIALIAYITVNTVILLLFNAIYLFYVQRYAMFLVMILLLIVPYSLYSIFQRYPVSLKNKFNWQATLAIAIMLFLFTDATFHMGADRSFYIRAGRWMQQHTAETTRVYVNNIQVLYYVNRPGMDMNQYFPEGTAVRPLAELGTISYPDFDYAVIAVTNRQVVEAENLLARLHFRPVMVLKNNHGDRIFILKTGSGLH